MRYLKFYRRKSVKPNTTKFGGQAGNESGNDYLKNGSNDFLQTYANIFLDVF